LKFWTLESSRKTQQNGGLRKTVRTASLAIQEKIANLSIQKDSSFTSIASSVWTNCSDDNRKQAGGLFPIYTLTDSGLVQFRARLKLTFFFGSCTGLLISLYTGILYLIHSGLSVRKSVILKVHVIYGSVPNASFRR
jgi:hypothetical protein